MIYKFTLYDSRNLRAYWCTVKYIIIILVIYDGRLTKHLYEWYDDLVIKYDKLCFIRFYQVVCSLCLVLHYASNKNKWQYRIVQGVFTTSLFFGRDNVYDLTQFPSMVKKKYNSRAARNLKWQFRRDKPLKKIEFGTIQGCLYGPRSSDRISYSGLAFGFEKFRMNAVDFSQQIMYNDDSKKNHHEGHSYG